VAQVWMNGAPLGSTFKKCSAYVAQEDVFVPTLSAWETLHFHAILRTPEGIPKEEIRQRINDVLTVMGLGRVRNTQASKLQRMNSFNGVQFRDYLSQDY
jgi:ABC-type multidrug transport system ATPase subunit